MGVVYGEYGMRILATIAAPTAVREVLVQHKTQTG